MPFRYLRDPLFIVCLVLYVLNRMVIKPVVSEGFFHAHLNDLICIPFLVPIMLYGMRLLRLRPAEAPPRLHEILIPLFVWSILFEIILPRHPVWGKGMTADHRDVFYYTLGAFFATVCWTYCYPPRST